MVDVIKKSVRQLLASKGEIRHSYGPIKLLNTQMQDIDHSDLMVLQIGDPGPGTY